MTMMSAEILSVMEMVPRWGREPSYPLYVLALEEYDRRRRSDPLYPTPISVLASFSTPPPHYALWRLAKHEEFRRLKRRQEHLKRLQEQLENY